jgi:antitoxin (DNA-binding transcriptional repressor) of toxin-antitoxin stability system
MSKIDVTATEAARNLSEYLNRVAYRGERFVIRRGSRPLAELGPVKRPALGSDLLAFFKRKGRLNPEELDSFEGDIEAGRDILAPTPENPWNT